MYMQILINRPTSRPVEFQLKKIYSFAFILNFLIIIYEEEILKSDIVIDLL